jgi:hypothetical protein
MTDPQRIASACDAIAATVARTLREWPVLPVAPALPRLPADLLRECAAAAGLATCGGEPTDG